MYKQIHTCKASECGLCMYISGVNVAFKGNLTPTTGLSRYGLLTLIPFTYVEIRLYF